MFNNQIKYSNDGFTLIEVLVVIAIIAVLNLLAIPSFQSFAADNKASEIGEAMFQHLTLARLEAIRQKRDILLCKMNSAQTGCDVSAGAWNYGWMVGRCNSTPPTTSIPDTTYNITSSHMTIPVGSVNMTSTNPGTNWIRFYRDGRIGAPKTPQNTSANFSTNTTPSQNFLQIINIKPLKCTTGKQITVTLMGGVSMSNIACP